MIEARVKTKWYGPSVKQKLRTGLNANLLAAGYYFRDAVRKDISRQGSAGVHSPPYHPPYRQTGELINSYSVEQDKAQLLVRMGSNLPYARYLEYGTSRMRMRPHLRTNIVSKARTLAFIIATPL